MNKQGNEEQDLTNIETGKLRDRLNRLYPGLRSSSGKTTAKSQFDYLWDLKEKALIEGRNTVEIPLRWLDELENHLGLETNKQGH